MQNFRPGVMARLGYGYEDFRKINPRIIYCSGSGYGESGPYVGRPGQDMLIQGLTGLAAATGRGDGPPVPVGAGFADQIGAMNMVYGILSALYWRERSGKGQEIKVDLLSGMLAHQNQEMVWVMNFGEDFERPNSVIGHPGMDAPFGVYPTSDGWVTIAMSPYTQAGRRARSAASCSPTTTRGPSSTSATRSGRRSPPRPASGPRRICSRRCSPSTSGAARSRATSR